MLKICLLFRYCRKHLESHRYDVVISTINETDFGRPGIQYIHFPWDYEPRPDADLRWYHGASLPLLIYRRSCRWISGVRPQGLRKNLTLVNSVYTITDSRLHYFFLSLNPLPTADSLYPIQNTLNWTVRILDKSKELLHLLPENCK